MSAPDSIAPDGQNWPAEWLAKLRRKTVALWRGVEAQHRIATMKIVDSAAEQSLLEDLLEQSKPALPTQAVSAHYLLATPFRYISRWPSRFRAPGEPGIWYGAEHLSTACAEVAYWRWRFAMDSEALKTQAVLSEHTFFEARVSGPVVDLGAAPWSALSPHWMAPSDYAACHRVARAARKAGAAWIRYRSVRDPQHRSCGAVLTLEALSMGDLTGQQTWACKVSATTVLMQPLAIASPQAPLEFGFS